MGETEKNWVIWIKLSQSSSAAAADMFPWACIQSTFRSPVTVQTYREGSKEAGMLEKPCHTWQDTSAQAWHPQSRVTACGVTVGLTRMGQPGGSQVRVGWPDPRAHPLVTMPRNSGGRDHVAVSTVQTWGAAKNRSHLTGHTASRLSDTLSLEITPNI